MMIRKNNEKYHIDSQMNDNRGSTIVTVLVAFLFVSVLVAIIMSTVVVNFRMRSIDRKTKDEFYYAEKALNDVYAGMGENCAFALGSAYNYVMSKYTVKAAGTYQDQVEAYDLFCKKYLASIYDSTSAPAGFGLSLNSFDEEKLKNKLNGYIVGDRAKVESIGGVKFYKSNKETEAATEYDMLPGVKYTVIKDVKIVSDTDSSDNSGYVSGITTDIVIETPQIDFFTVNEKGLDYALVANDGIEFNGNAVINGSVFGGSRPTAEINDISVINSHAGELGYKKYMTNASDYGGILVNGSNVTINGEYVISGGDIYIDEREGHPGNLTISHGAKNEIWFDNLTLAGKKSKVNIAGDLYAQGDIQVDGDESEAVIKGSFFGYNDGSDDSSYISKADKLLDRDERSLANRSTRSSSIVINSKESKIDMRDLDTFVLLGKAYINHNSKRTSNAETSLEVQGDYSDISKIDDIGESVALKSGQEIFLVPSEFLNGDTNPYIYETVTFDFNVDKDAMAGWFGWQYLNPTDPIKTVKMVKNGVNRAYCYLNFGGANSIEINENQRKYVADIVNGTSSVDGCEPTPDSINFRLKHTNKNQHSQILIGDDDTRIYASGSIVQYKFKEESETEDTISVKGNSEGFSRYNGYSGSMHQKYQRLCTYLDAMTSGSFSAGSVTDVSEEDYESPELPFGKLFWESGIKNISEGGVICSREPNPEGGYKDYVKNAGSTVIVCRGNGGDAFFDGDKPDDTNPAVDIAKVLADNGNPQNVFMIVLGDAYVDDNVNINGFIYVQGELIVRKDVTLTVTYNSTLLDKRIEAELKKLKEVYLDERSSDPGVKLRDCYDNRTLIYYILNYKIPENGDPLGPKVEQLADGVSSSIEAIDAMRKYSIDINTGDATYDVTSDYTQFMYFENWRKGR